ncbi:MAG: hypothetical protein ABI426_11550 [Flavobacterium sp.]
MMKVTSKVPPFKIISAVLSIALCCCIGFSYKIYNDFSEAKKILNNEKSSLINDLRISKDSLEVAISENSDLKTELIVERQKVTNLLDEISNTNIDAYSLIKYKMEVRRLKGVVAVISKEKAQLKRNYDLLKIQRDSTILVLTNANKYRETLKNMNEDLSNTIKKGSKISVINLKAKLCKQSRRGVLEPTDKAKEVDVLQIAFMVIGNKMNKSCDKEYYVQIIDGKSNIVGKRKTKRFGELILDYSFESPVKFKNETMEVTAELAFNKVEKGIYYVNVFDKSELASKTTFVLR